MEGSAPSCRGGSCPRFRMDTQPTARGVTSLCSWSWEWGSAQILHALIHAQEMASTFRTARLGSVITEEMGTSSGPGLSKRQYPMPVGAALLSSQVTFSSCRREEPSSIPPPPPPCLPIANTHILIPVLLCLCWMW